MYYENEKEWLKKIEERNELDRNQKITNARLEGYEKGKSEGKFIGFAHVKTHASKTVIDASLNMQIVYWGKRIPAIVDSEILPSSNKKNSGGKRNEKK